MLSSMVAVNRKEQTDARATRPNSPNPEKRIIIKK
jgi:hypothetical protein